MIRLLLLASEDTSGPLIKLIADSGAGYYIASSPEDALNYMRENALNGVIINVPLFMRMEGKGKIELSEVLSIFPTLRFRVDKRNEMTVFDSEHDNPQLALEHFFNAVCLQTPQRIIRQNERVTRYFNILLSSDPTFPPEATERTSTMNVSLDGNGCFCFSVRNWKVSQQAWLQFLDLEDKTPISAEIMHSNRWGHGCRLPGGGMRFISMTEEQRKQLILLCKQPPS